MGIPYFDLHCDTIFECSRQGLGLYENSLHLDIKRLLKFDKAAQVFALWGRPDYMLTRHMDTANSDASSCDMAAVYSNLLSCLKTEFSANADTLRHCRTYDDIADTPRGMVSALVSIEGAELIQCSISKLEQAYADGVRLLNLCWNFDNCLTGSVSGRDGLTRQGMEFVRAAQDMGVILDMSHISDLGFWDVMKISRAPVFASHSNSRSVCGHKRNLSDDMFKALIAQHGIAGINLYPEFLGGDLDLDAAVSHIEHFLNLGGEGCICLGGDLDGIDTLPRGYTGVSDTIHIYDILKNRGYSEKLCQDLLYNNALSFFERALI